MYYVPTFITFAIAGWSWSSTWAQENNKLVKGATCWGGIAKRRGTCKFLEDCPEAEHLYQNFDYSYVCDFINSVALICCIPNDKFVISERENYTAPNFEELYNKDLVLSEHENILTAVFESGTLSTKFCYWYVTEFRQQYADQTDRQDDGINYKSSFSHMATIDYGYSDNELSLCSGSLISSKFVLTAAHCVTGQHGVPKFVRLGNPNSIYRNERNYTVVNSIPHPDYNPPSKYGDIALLELDQEVNFTNSVFPACLNTRKEINETKMYTARLCSALEECLSPTQLTYYASDDNCLSLFDAIPENDLPHGIIEDIQICAKSKYKSLIMGDSGGPLYVPLIKGSPRRYINKIIGVTSFGKPATESAAPTIFTRVDSYLTWIEINVWKDEYHMIELYWGNSEYSLF